jgi:hypothetical protein
MRAAVLVGLFGAACGGAVDGDGSGVGTTGQGGNGAPGDSGGVSVGGAFGLGGNGDSGGNDTGGVSVGGAFGLGGNGDSGGVAGMAVPRCVPGQSIACVCTDSTQGAQVCQADGTYASCVCTDTAFEQLRQAMVGTWLGQDSNPWTEPYTVQITFSADGHYSGHCAQPSCPAPVFYYGLDDDSPLKTYEIRDIHTDGTGGGRIAILWDESYTDLRELDMITPSPDLTQLHFEFWNGDYGPVVFDLTRVP